MTEEKRLFTPAEAAEYVSKVTGKKVTVSRIAQYRRAGDVEGMQMGYNVTVFTRDALDGLARMIRDKQKGKDQAA